MNNIIVCVKQVPDIEKDVKIVGKVIDAGSDFVLNPLDEHAVREAVTLKEKFGGKITVLTLGQGRARQALLRCLARGADEAILYSAPDCNFDSTAISVVLAEKIKILSFDLILFGGKAADTNSGDCGVQVAKLLGLPCIPEIIKLEIGEGKAVAVRQMDGGDEVIECSLPAVFTCQKGINELNIIPLPKIKQADKKPLKVEECVCEKIFSEIIGFEPIVNKREGVVLKGSIEEQVKQLVEIFQKRGILEA